jgi:hypothetical protein
MNDPLEQIESQIENQIAKVDANGDYPCCYCGAMVPVEDLIVVSPNPAAPGMCIDCADVEYGADMKVKNTITDTDRLEWIAENSAAIRKCGSESADQFYYVIYRNGDISEKDNDLRKAIDYAINESS